MRFHIGHALRMQVLLLGGSQKAPGAIHFADLGFRLMSRWVWVKIKPPGDRWFWSILPFTRVPLGYPFVTHSQIDPFGFGPFPSQGKTQKELSAGHLLGRTGTTLGCIFFGLFYIYICARHPYPYPCACTHTDTHVYISRIYIYICTLCMHIFSVEFKTFRAW